MHSASLPFRCCGCDLIQSLRSEGNPDEDEHPQYEVREVLGGHLASSVRERQALLSEVRAQLLYDWQGEEDDAFNALLEELVAVVSGLKRREDRLEKTRKA